VLFSDFFYRVAVCSFANTKSTMRIRLLLVASSLFLASVCSIGTVFDPKSELVARALFVLEATMFCPCSSHS
jgi:hypothetical protein